MADPRLQWRSLQVAQPNVAGLMGGANDSLMAAGEAAKGILASYQKGSELKAENELARRIGGRTQEELTKMFQQGAFDDLNLGESGLQTLNSAISGRANIDNSNSIVRDRDGRLTIARNQDSRAGEEFSWAKDNRNDALARRDWERNNAGLFLEGEQNAFTAGLAPASLVRTESGGNFAARNDAEGAGGTGHFGRVQFGRARFAEAQAAGAVPQGMTIEQFGQDTPESRAAQIQAEQWHFGDIQNRITEAGLDRYIGQTIGGVEITRDGMVAMAHLGGFSGLRQFLESEGRYNPADGYGTSLSDYARTHAGNTTGPSAQPFSPTAIDRGGSAYARAMAESGLFSGQEALTAIDPLRTAATQGQALIDQNNAQTVTELTAIANQEILANPEIVTLDQARDAVFADERFTATENEQRYRQIRDLIENDPNRLRPAVPESELAATDAIIESTVRAADRAIDANPQTSLLAAADRMAATETNSVGQNLAAAVGLDSGNRENPTSWFGNTEAGFNQADLDRLIARTANRNNVSEEVAAAALARAYQDDPWGKNTLENRFNADTVDEIIKSIDQQDQRDYDERRGNVGILRQQLEAARSSEILIRSQMRQYPEGSAQHDALKAQLNEVMRQMGQLENQLSTSETN